MILSEVLTGMSCKKYSECKDCPMNTIGSMLNYLNSKEPIKLTPFEYDVLAYYANTPLYQTFRFCDSSILTYLKGIGWFKDIDSDMFIKDIIKNITVVEVTINEN